MYLETQNEFKRNNPSFDAQAMEHTFGQIQRLHNQFPTFLAGFDLIGQEDTSAT